MKILKWRLHNERVEDKWSLEVYLCNIIGVLTVENERT